jgi:hypothetical protein
VSIDSSTVLILIPIVFAGIIAISVIGSLDEKTRGDRISKFFSIASNAAIFFTVLALVYQVIDSQQKSKHDAHSQLLDPYSRLNQIQMEHPEIFKVINPNVEYNRLGTDEQLALQYTNSVIQFFDRVHTMHRDGEIDYAMWKGWQEWIRFSSTNSEYFLNIWNDTCGVYHAEFVNYIEQIYDDGVCGETGGQIDNRAGTQVATPNR